MATDEPGSGLEPGPNAPAASSAPTGSPATPVQAAATPAAAVAITVDGTGSVMSLIGHLDELRKRIVRAVLAVLLGSIVGFMFAEQVIDVLISPLPTGQVQVLAPGDAFFINVKIALIFGVIVAMPVILYQGWRFVAPGLTDRERRAVAPWVLLSLVFFAMGVAIAWFVLPYATAFLLGFTSDRLVANLAAGPYFDFVTTLVLAFGIVMEFPILLYGLARAGILGSARLRSSRRYAILGIAVFAAIATPGGDLVSPGVLGITMYILYELTILLIRRSGR